MLNNTADQLRDLLTSHVPVKVSLFGILPCKQYKHQSISGQYWSYHQLTELKVVQLLCRSAMQGGREAVRIKCHGCIREGLAPWAAGGSVLAVPRHAGTF